MPAALNERRQRVRAAAALSALLVFAATAAGARPAEPSACVQGPAVVERCARWSRNYDHSGGAGGAERDFVEAIAASPTSDLVFVTGWSFDDATRLDVVTEAYRRDGTLAWSQRFDRGDDDRGRALTTSADGQLVFVTGSTADRATDDILTIAYDAATGDEVWRAVYDGAASLDDAGFAIISAPDGSRVYVAGVGDRPGLRGAGDVAVVALATADGAREWVWSYDGPDGLADVATGIDVSPDGADVVVAGYSQGAGTQEDFVTAVLRADDGASAWVTRYDSGHGMRDYAAGERGAGVRGWNDAGSAFGRVLERVQLRRALLRALHGHTAVERALRRCERTRRHGRGDGHEPRRRHRVPHR